MAEAIERINEGDIPRNLNAPPGPNGTLGIRIEIAKLIDENISTNPKLNGKSESSSDKTKKLNNNEIVREANESIEMTYNRLDKLLNEEIGESEEKN